MFTGIELEGGLAGINGNRDRVESNSCLQGVLITRGNVMVACIGVEGKKCSSTTGADMLGSVLHKLTLDGGSNIGLLELAVVGATGSVRV